MSARPHNARLLLDAPDGSQESFATVGIIETRIQVGDDPPRSLDREDLHITECSGHKLCPELIGEMEVRGCEPTRPRRRIAVLAIDHVPLDDRLEVGVVDEATDQRIESRCEP